LLKDDKRWKYGKPPEGNANYAWVQHFIHHLAPTGLAGFVLANGSMSSNQSGEGDIRKAIIEADLVDCMVALPGQLFYKTQIPVCLWILARDKKKGRFKDRRGKVLFIDARKLGTLIDRVHRDLSDDDIAKIADTYHAWRGDARRGSPDPAETADRRSQTKKRDLQSGKVARSETGHSAGERPDYKDVAGFCKSATLDDIRQHGHILTPGRYVGAAEVEDDGEPFEDKMTRLTGELREQTQQSAKLDQLIWANLEDIGYGG
jgi:type I restriction enzyme M protein